jgi:phage-related baseplate assembly protein
MDLTTLPDITFCDTDTASIEASVITAYEDAAGVSLAPGDPVRLFLETLAYLVVQQRAVIDFTGKQNLLRYAAGSYLDHLGALLGVARLPASPALTTIRFAVDTALLSVVTIPLGTRVATSDGQVVFTTTAMGEIAAGELFVDVAAQSIDFLTAANGYVAGQINKLVDPIPFVTSVSNITTSAGAADVEDDDNLRERIRIAPESFSVAGPSGAYEFWAKTAHQDIIDVAVYSPAAGEVEVRPLLIGGTLPSSDILAAVDSVVNDRNIRPLTDKVTVLAPEAVNYNVIATYYISRLDSALVSDIQTAANTALSDYLTWQRQRLGRDITPSELTRRLMDAGAKRVVLTSPGFTILEPWQVAAEGTVALTYGGVEDE